MSTLTIETVFVVGAGFSAHAGLPLTSELTEAILEARDFSVGESRTIAEFLSEFIHQVFDHSRKAGAKHWPDLEDIFTCVDLSANTGHYLGRDFPPALLRTVRRTMLSRIIRMLDHRYRLGRRRKSPEWQRLDEFFWEVRSQNVGFLSMNWDTVIERKLAHTRENLSLDYCCDALPASVPDLPDVDEYSSYKKFVKAVEEGQRISAAALPLDRKLVESSTPVVKIHGSANWLYCDSCRQVFWFHPDQSSRIAYQVVREDDRERMRAVLSKRKHPVKEGPTDFIRRTQVKCLCSGAVPLGTRIATFSFRKGLDFPMFQKSWLAAEELLRSARRWVFIGYSLPAADYEFKYLLKRTQLSRSSKPEFVVVSGGRKKDVRRTYNNYQRFFGRSVTKSNFFGSGLTKDAINACCR